MNSRLTLVAVSAAALAVVTACSSSGGSGAATSSSAAPPASTSAVAAAPSSSVAVAGGGAQPVSLKAGHLVAADGRSLYILTSDQPGHPACSGACLQTWPPLTGTAMPGAGVGDDFATLARGAGTQITYDKHPLYEFSGDTAPGDTKGDGIKAFGGTWQLATSDKGANSSSASSSASSKGGGGYKYP